MEKYPIYGGKYPGLKWKSIQIYEWKVFSFMFENYQIIKVYGRKVSKYQVYFIKYLSLWSRSTRVAD